MCELYIHAYIYIYMYIHICLSASWTHGLIAKSVRVYEGNSVVSGRGFKSHSDQFSVANSKNPSMMTTEYHIYMYMYWFVYIYMYIWEIIWARKYRPWTRLIFMTVPILSCSWRDVWIEIVRMHLEWTGFLTTYLLKMRVYGGNNLADVKLY